MRSGRPGWTVLKQVHGARVVIVSEPGTRSGEEADGAVSRTPGAALAILTADCAPVLLASEDGVIGAAHAGWRGLAAGVLEATVRAMRDLGATGRISSAVGPCISPECYEFSADDLAEVAALLGDEVRATSADGRAALDVPTAVRSELRRLQVSLVHEEASCTACEADRWYSHRARRDEERQAAVIWLPEQA